MADQVFVRQRSYIKIKHIGSGMFGKVYLVKDAEENDLYALKQINIENSSHAASIQTEFLAMLASLRHRHIIHLFSGAIAKSGESQLIANFIMEYCPGGTLNDRLSIPSSRVLDVKWMLQLADAVAFLHQKGIVHRDLKADNVLLTANDNVKVCDLGLASFSFNLQKLNPVRRDISSHESEQVGTPCFWAPEIFNGYNHHKPSDVFALGHILYAIKERCYVNRKASKLKRLYGAFIKIDDSNTVSLGQAQSKHLQPCCLAFNVDKNAVDIELQNITKAALANHAHSRPRSEQVYKYLKSAAKLLVEIKRQKSTKTPQPSEKQSIVVLQFYSA